MPSLKWLSFFFKALIFSTNSPSTMSWRCCCINPYESSSSSSKMHFWGVAGFVSLLLWLLSHCFLLCSVLFYPKLKKKKESHCDGVDTMKWKKISSVKIQYEIEKQGLKTLVCLKSILFDNWNKNITVLSISKISHFIFYTIMNWSY